MQLMLKQLRDFHTGRIFTSAVHTHAMNGCIWCYTDLPMLTLYHSMIIAMICFSNAWCIGTL
jgi:hypothetical protein